MMRSRARRNPNHHSSAQSVFAPIRCKKRGPRPHREGRPKDISNQINMWPRSLISVAITDYPVPLNSSPERKISLEAVHEYRTAAFDMAVMRGNRPRVLNCDTDLKNPLPLLHIEHNFCFSRKFPVVITVEQHAYTGIRTRKT